MKKFILAAVSAAALALSLTSAANADVIWNVTGTFNDGGALSGTFGINQYGYLSGFNFVTTAGSIDPGFTYTPASSYFSNGAFYVDAQPGYFSDLHLAFLNDISILAATDPIIGGLNGPSFECVGSFSCPAGGATRYLTSGIATAVPEPVTISLFSAGLIGAAGLRRRKKAKQD